MKLLNLNLVATLLFFYAHQSLSQKIDTLVDVGGYKLHFTIIKGKGTPILFEAGSGGDGTDWENIVQPIANITGTTLLTHDREGFGKSELNKGETSEEKHGIQSGVEALEIGLKKLGYDKDIIFVAHSYGGLYATLYSARHPNLVKSVVFIDGNHANCMSETYIKTYFQPDEIAKRKSQNLGAYYEGFNFATTIAMMKKIVFPTTIPSIDIVSDIQFLPDQFQTIWKECHKEFNHSHPNNQSITALGSGHAIFIDNPPLAIDAIVKSYCSRLNQTQRMDVLNRHLEYSIAIANDAKKQEMDFRHSEDDLTKWGYSLMQQNQLPKALEVFKLNTFLHPSSWSGYDSYGEALLKAGQKEEAIKMYRKSIELNPKNETGKKVLDSISK